MDQLMACEDTGIIVRNGTLCGLYSGSSKSLENVLPAIGRNHFEDTENHQEHLHDSQKMRNSLAEDLDGPESSKGPELEESITATFRRCRLCAPWRVLTRILRFARCSSAISSSSFQTQENPL